VTTLVQIGPDSIQAITPKHLQNVVGLDFSGKVIDDFSADVAKYGAQVDGIANSTADVAIRAPGLWTR
jgi:hypothetical protein